MQTLLCTNVFRRLPARPPRVVRCQDHVGRASSSNWRIRDSHDRATPIAGAVAPGPVTTVLIHPAGGGLGDYLALAARLGRRGPVYGLRGSGLAAGEQPDRSVAAMVRRYRHALLTLPTAPTLLAGWSLGGILAWELAGELATNGTRPAVVMIDSLALTLPGQRVNRSALHSAVRRYVVPGAEKSALNRALSTADAHLEAAARHAVRTRHDGAALLLTCDGEEREHQVEHWTRGCPRLRHRQIPGGHFDVFGPAALPVMFGHLDKFLTTELLDEGDMR